MKFELVNEICMVLAFTVAKFPFKHFYALRNKKCIPLLLQGSLEEPYQTVSLFLFRYFMSLSRLLDLDLM